MLYMECGDLTTVPEPSDLVYCSWPEVFGSAVGPFRGAGGQAMTTFRMEAYAWEDWAVVFCNGRIVKTGVFAIGAHWRQTSR